MPESDAANLPVDPAATRIGWIGAGVMGSSMCGRLLDAGFPAVVFTRTRAKAEPLLARGAEWADSPAAVARAADVVFSIVGYPADVREVHLGPRGTLTALRTGGVLVDMTTSEPRLAVELAEAARAQGATALDAPVTGGDVGAKNGTLSIMVGGDRPTAERLAPCWQAMGSKWVWHGESGAGQHAKLANQTLAAGGMIGVCEALLYARRAGLDLEKVFDSVAGGAAGSWAFSNLGPRIIRGDFAPGFYVEHFVKDMGLVLEESRRMRLALPGLALVEQLYRSALAKGHGRSGTQALLLALADISAVDWPQPK
jgi:3-hydroxyisobutyrate dehydrogenase